MLLRTLKMAFWISYDHLGKLVAANLISMVAALPLVMAVYGGLALNDPAAALAVAAPAGLLLFGLVLPVAGAGMAAMVKECIDTRDGTLRTFFTGLRQYGLKAAALGVAYTAVVCCLLVSAWFYTARFGGHWPLLGYTLGALAVWCLALVLLSILLVAPALVQKNAGLWETAKLCVLLVLANPLFCLCLAIYCLFWTGLSLAPPVLLLFSLAPVVVLVSSAYELLARKYAALETHMAPPENGGLVKIDFREEEDDYLNRGFRDFLFPWKG